jgi:hypothetical protein
VSARFDNDPISDQICAQSTPGHRSSHVLTQRLAAAAISAIYYFNTHPAHITIKAKSSITAKPTIREGE